MLFYNNDIFENSFNSFRERDEDGGMIFITDSVALIYSNRVSYNGHFDYGLPFIFVYKGAAILEDN